MLQTLRIGTVVALGGALVVSGQTAAATDSRQDCVDDVRTVFVYLQT